MSRPTNSSSNTASLGESSKSPHLRRLEAESVHVFREVLAQCERPVILFSVGKDSTVLLRLAQKAFHPAPIPFPLLHVDTSYKFPEMYAFRDRLCAEMGLDLRVATNTKAVGDGTAPWLLGTTRCCSLLKTQALLEALEDGRFDAAIGGARRDEERSRAKERVFSFRDRRGQWDPRHQRPELWNLYNARIDPGESVRVFPLSNWTELDVWTYIHEETIPVVPLYFAREREVLVRDGGQLILPEMLPAGAPLHGERKRVWCRFRTLGCSPCTGAVESRATTVLEILEEMSSSRESERAHRAIDHDVDGSMERKKREGYF